MQPIVGYNYGARQYERMLRAFELTAVCATIVMGCVFLLGEIVPRWMVLLFEPEPIMGVWWSIPTSDTISALVAAVMIWVQVKGFREG